MSNPMLTHGHPSWIEFNGSDPAGARKFYESILDWQVNDMPMGDGSSYPVIAIGETPVGGFSPRPAEDGGWTVYITVDDVNARFDKAVKAGATAVSEPTDVPGVGRMATIRDPQGASLALITYENQQ
jgi:predicted enzyme related to lactoylglutathione lyase